MLITDFAWVAGGRVIATVLAFLSFRVSTTLLSAEEFGYLSILLAFQAFSGLLMISPVGQYIARNLHKWLSDSTLICKLKKFRVYVVFSALCGGLAISIWIFDKPLSLDDKATFVTLLVFMVISATWNGTYIDFLNMLGFRFISIFWTIITSFTSLLASITLVYFLNDCGWAWFAGHSIGMCIGAIGARYQLRSHVADAEELDSQPFVDAITVRDYMLPLAMALGLMWCLVAGHRIVLESYWGTKVLGGVAVTFGLANRLFNIAESILMQFLYPFYYRNLSISDMLVSQKAFSDLINILGPVYIALGAAATFSGSALLKLFVSNEFFGGILWFQMGVFFEVSRVGCGLFGIASQIGGNTRFLIRPYFFASCVMLTLLILLGRNGVCIETALFCVVVSGFIMFFLMVIQVRKKLSFVIDTKRWGFSFSVLMASVIVSLKFNVLVDSVEKAMFVVSLVGLGMACCILLLLWKNQALKSLLNAKLKDESLVNV